MADKRQDEAKNILKLIEEWESINKPNDSKGSQSKKKAEYLAERKSTLKDLEGIDPKRLQAIKDTINIYLSKSDTPESKQEKSDNSDNIELLEHTIAALVRVQARRNSGPKPTNKTARGKEKKLRERIRQNDRDRYTASLINTLSTGIEINKAVLLEEGQPEELAKPPRRTSSTIPHSVSVQDLISKFENAQTVTPQFSQTKPRQRIAKAQHSKLQSLLSKLGKRSKRKPPDAKQPMLSHFKHPSNKSITPHSGRETPATQPKSNPVLIRELQQTLDKNNPTKGKPSRNS